MRVPALALTTLALLAAPSSGRGGLDASHPVTVGATRIVAAAPAELDARIADAWLRDEARALGIPAGRVADSLAGPRGTGIPDRFERYHERHRAATRCLAAVHDPLMDRCVDRPPAPEGTCRWMGEATICRLARGWLTVHGARARRHRRRGGAVRHARQLYLQARSQRDRLMRVAAGDRVRAVAGVRRAAAAARRAEIAADPRLSPAALPAARRACLLYRQEAEPYLFGLGMQDPAGTAAGLAAARATLVRRLRVLGDDRKLRPLLRELRAPDVIRSLPRTGPIAKRLGLSDCAVV